MNRQEMACAECCAPLNVLGKWAVFHLMQHSALCSHARSYGSACWYDGPDVGLRI